MPVHRAMDSGNAMDCLLSLNRTALVEREDLVHLNDKLIDMIEHVHYMEAEHSALEHDYNLLKTGIESNSSYINEVFEVEIRNIRSEVESANKGRQQLLHDQNNLSQQVKQVEQQWRHTAKAALGVPKEVDDEFRRISQIEAENSLTIKRTKYVEDKNRLIKQNNGRIYEQINLMRMRKDQAVSLHQDYAVRRNELLNSIRNLEEENKRTIMNEHKYFTRDRTVDRHTFRNQLREAIAQIRADYESKRLRTEEEIRIRTESEISRIQSSVGGNGTHDRLKEELEILKRNMNGTQQQVHEVEIRNASLTQQIELLRLEISENHVTFEFTLDAKIKEIEKMKEQCMSMTVELEKLCDLNINLQKEIDKYRELLDRSGNVRVISSTTKPQFGITQLTGNVTRTPLVHDVPSYPKVENTVIGHSPVYVPPSIPAPVTPLPLSPLPPLPTYEHTYEPARIDNTRIESRITSRTDSPFSTGVPTYVPSPYRPYEVPPSVDIPSSQQNNSTTLFTQSTTYVDNRAHEIPSRPSPTSTRGTVVNLDSYSPPGRPSPKVETVAESNITREHSRRIDTISGQDATGRGHQSSYSSSSTQLTNTVVPRKDVTGRSDRRGTTIFIPNATNTTTTVQNDGKFEYSSDADSVDEEHFQRFTRWYNGRIKIMDVTPEYIHIVNRSSKKSVDVGGYKVIHEYGHKSVYVDLPTGLILEPKKSLKIFARSATHEYGSVVAEIDLFDTTTRTNTSIRNTRNEVKSWFVYTSNTEIGDHHH